MKQKMSEVRHELGKSNKSMHGSYEVPIPHVVMRAYPVYDITELKMDIMYYVPIAG